MVDVLVLREGDAVVVVVVVRVAPLVRLTCVAPVRVGVAVVVRVAVDTLLFSRATLVVRVTVVVPRVVVSAPRTAAALPPRVRTFVLPNVELRVLVLCSDKRVCPERPTVASVRAALRTAA